MLCYIVRKITTMSVPQSYAGYDVTVACGNCGSCFWRCDFTFPRSFVSVLVVPVVFASCSNEVCGRGERRYGDLS